MYDLDGEMSGTDELLQRIEQITGLKSELLILSSAVGWVPHRCLMLALCSFHHPLLLLRHPSTDLFVC